MAIVGGRGRGNSIDSSHSFPGERNFHKKLVEILGRRNFFVSQAMTLLDQTGLNPEKKFDLLMKARNQVVGQIPRANLDTFGIKIAQVGRLLGFDDVFGRNEPSLEVHREVRITPAALYSETQFGTVQSSEFQHTPRHDDHFNLRDRAIKESWLAAVILKNPETFGGGIDHFVHQLASVLLPILEMSPGDRSPTQSFFLEKMVGDVDKSGQLAQIRSDDMQAVLAAPCDSTLHFAQKTLLVKAFGAFLIDHASANPEAIGSELGIDLSKLPKSVDTYREAALFGVCGRSKIQSKEVTQTIGIIDQSTFDALAPDFQEFLSVAELERERPKFHVMRKEPRGDEMVVSPFVARTMDSHRPLIGSISGSTSCCLVSMAMLDPEFLGAGENTVEIGLSVASFLVGGGYHSFTEIFDVIFPFGSELDLVQTTISRLNSAGHTEETARYLAFLGA